MRQPDDYTETEASYIERIKELEQQNQSLLEVMEFVLSPKCEEPMVFLSLWYEGDFEPIKEEWPDFKGYVGEVI